MKRFRRGAESRAKIGDDYVNVEHVSMVSKIPDRQGRSDLYMCGVHLGEVDQWYAAKLLDEMRALEEGGQSE